MSIEPAAAQRVRRNGGKINGAFLLFIGHDPPEGDARGVVDADMDERPADAAAVGLAGAVAGDAVADTIEPAALLDVHVDELAGMFALVTVDGSAGSGSRMRLIPRRRGTRLTVTWDCLDFRVWTGG